MVCDNILKLIDELILLKIWLFYGWLIEAMQLADSEVLARAHKLDAAFSSHRIDSQGCHLFKMIDIHSQADKPLESVLKSLGEEVGLDLRREAITRA
jgi:hypothetical protein